ncbi:MAG: lipopolysaccharide biosynthesis protein [Planctomycetia bacterium]|nr:lipopolysaccharide biosynthesis protein [Planctomycetia bacterium]
MTDEKQNLTQRSAKAAVLVMAFHFLRQFSGVFIGILLVRLLSPDDYGTVACLAIFMACGDAFVYGGFGLALVQKKDVRPIDYDTVFYYNIAACTVCYVAMCLASPLIADFFRLPILRKIIPVMALMFPIAALGANQLMILVRELKQDISLKCSFIGFVLGGVIALIMAYCGAGVWTLVCQPLIHIGIQNFCVFLHVRWMPRLRFSFQSLREMFRFGSALLLADLITRICDNVYNVAIGKRSSEVTLGYYNRANSYTGLWPHSLVGVVSSVFFPAFSRLQDDPHRLRDAMHRSLVMLAEISIFPILLLCALNQPFIELVLSSRWFPCFWFWWPLTLVMVVRPITELNLYILKARGRSDRFFWLELISKLMIGANILLFWDDGAMAMVWGAVVVAWGTLGLSLLFTRREIGYPVTRQLRDCLPCLAVSLTCCLAAWELSVFLWPDWSWGALLLPVLLGGTLYVSVHWWFQTEPMRIAIGLVEPKFPKLRRLWRFCRWPDSLRNGAVSPGNFSQGLPDRSDDQRNR